MLCTFILHKFEKGVYMILYFKYAFIHYVVFIYLHHHETDPYLKYHMTFSFSLDTFASLLHYYLIKVMEIS